MYYFLSLFCGVVISVMVASNAGLSNISGMHFSTFFVHLTGMCAILTLALVKKAKLKHKPLPWYYYIGGALGVVVVITNTYSFAPLGVSAMLAVGLLGQSVSSIVIDHFGLFGMAKYEFKPKRIIALAIMLVGIMCMIHKFHFFAVVCSIITGVSLVFQRVFNGKVSECTSVYAGSLLNYLTATPLTIIIFVLFGLNEPIITNFTLPTNIFPYLGGVIGASTVLMSNICVSKVPSYSLSVLIFIGQVFTGVIIDSMLLGQITVANIIGGTIVSIGLIVDMKLSK